VLFQEMLYNFLNLRCHILILLPSIPVILSANFHFNLHLIDDLNDSYYFFMIFCFLYQHNYMQAVLFLYLYQYLFKLIFLII
jgi:hypothetical protein